MHGNRGSH